MSVIRESLPELQFQTEWKSGEIAVLRNMVSMGAEAVAVELGRSVSSVRMQAHRQGISLRPPGEKRGRTMGIPNGMGSVRDVAKLRKIRELVESGEIDPSAVVRYMKAQQRGEDL